MSPFRHRQRGEGKIGCIVSLLVLGIGVAVGFKAVPVYWNNSELKDAAKDLASRASVLPVESIELQLRSKAKELGIDEAMASGAIKASKSGDAQQGTCNIRLSYIREINLYGFYKWNLVVNETISAPYIQG